MSEFPEHILHRIYAGVLGKLIGVYLGRPFENWTYQQILERLGPIYYYVNDKLNLPLVVVDDDVSGTFTFVRALEEHGFDPNITSEQIGRTWLNQVIEHRTIFWWGGNGISTEHTVFVNLKDGVKPPMSGSREKNGQTLSEQIGAQIFIDGWAMVAAGNPALAARLAEAAARVSHDGVAVDAAVLWAVMEAEAFNSADVDHLLETGLTYIPKESNLRTLITDIREWANEDKDWRKTRQRVEDNYGYDKYGGICHMIPNHGTMILALLYGGHSFSHAMHIVNTCGWDTDCNSGNIGCLVAIMHGLDGFEDDKYDWRGPLADRAIISSADAGYSMNNAPRIAYGLANIAAKLAGLEPPKTPKNGAQYHFSLPGSTQGFQSSDTSTVQISHGCSHNVDALQIGVIRNINEEDNIEVMVQTFTPKDVLEVSRDYEMMASPLVYSGQTLEAQLRACTSNQAFTKMCLSIEAYMLDENLLTIISDPHVLAPGASSNIEWTIPSRFENEPIEQIGIAIRKATKGDKIWLDNLSWTEAPNMTFVKPGPSSIGVDNHGTTFWQRAWVSSLQKVYYDFGPSLLMSQDYGEGVHYQGTREWTDYAVEVKGFVVNLGKECGIIARVQGLNRWFGLLLRTGKNGQKYVAVVKAMDEERSELARMQFDWTLDQAYCLSMEMYGERIEAKVDGMAVKCRDGTYRGGAAGFLVNSGSVSADSMRISPAT